jgi:hypothetical protein
VPTREDFANLHQNLGFTLPAQGGSVAHNNNGMYMHLLGSAENANIGGSWDGARFAGHATNILHEGSDYWSSSEVTAGGSNAHVLNFRASTVGATGTGGIKNGGHALRCVR